MYKVWVCATNSTKTWKAIVGYLLQKQCSAFVCFANLLIHSCAGINFSIRCSLVSVLRAVLELMGENPFPDHPPKFIRASLYRYHFTSKDKNDETRSASHPVLLPTIVDYTVNVFIRPKYAVVHKTRCFSSVVIFALILDYCCYSKHQIFITSSLLQHAARHLAKNSYYS